jgi:C-terminal processing protease CtpA/Prc
MDQVAGSGITVSTAGDGSKVTAKSRKKKKKRKIIVVVPPGKLGIVLSNRNDGKGTFVAEVRPTSSMRDMIAPGDKIVGVDEQDVTRMTVNEITSLMANRSTDERRLTFVSTSYSDAAASEAGSHTERK